MTAEKKDKKSASFFTTKGMAAVASTFLSVNNTVTRDVRNDESHDGPWWEL